MVVVVALALWCGGVESKAPAPKKPKGGGGGGEITVTITIKWKRNYKVSCKDKGGPDCYVGCPKECPNKCIASCTRCRSFCSTLMKFINLRFPVSVLSQTFVYDI